MATIAELQVRIGADLTDLQRKLDGAQSKMRDFGEKMGRIGRELTSKITAPIVGVGVAVLKTASDFETGMNKVRALTGASGDEFEALKEQAKELGATTQFSAGQAADAMGFLAMAGFDTDQIMGSMKDTLNLAAAAQMDLGEAADIVSNVMTGYGLDTEEASRATDVLTKSFTSANTDLAQLGQAMKFAGPVASGAGVEFEEAAAALGLMGNAGIQASMAGTSLRGAISRLLNPVGEASATISDLGIQALDSDGNLKSLENIVAQLETSGASTADMMTIFGQRAGPAMQALVSQGSGALRDMTEELRNSGGTAENIANIQMEGLRGALLKLKSAAEAMAISIAESGLLEWVTDIADRLAGFVRRLADTNPKMLKMATIAAGLAAAIGPIALAISGVIAVMNPWAIAIAGLIAAGTALIANWGDISAWFTGKFPNAASKFQEVWGNIRSKVTLEFNRVKQIVKDVLDWVQAFWNEWGDEITGVASAIFNHVVSVVKTGLSVIGDVFGAFINLFTGDWSGLWGNIKGIFGAVWDGIKSIFTNAINGLIALMPDFVKEWFGLTEDFRIGSEEMEQATRNFKSAAEGATTGTKSYKEALDEAGQQQDETAASTSRVTQKTQEFTQTVDGLRKKLDDAMIPAWKHYNGLVIQGVEANSELDASVLRTTTSVEDMEQPVNDLSLGFKDWMAVLSSGSGVGSAIEMLKGKLGNAGGLIELIGGETGLLGKITGPDGLLGALGVDGGLIGKFQKLAGVIGVSGPLGIAMAGAIGLVVEYREEINKAIGSVSDFLGLSGGATDSANELIVSQMREAILFQFEQFRAQNPGGTVGEFLEMGGEEIASIITRAGLDPNSPDQIANFLASNGFSNLSGFQSLVDSLISGTKLRLGANATAEQLFNDIMSGGVLNQIAADTTTSLSSVESYLANALGYTPPTTGAEDGGTTGTSTSSGDSITDLYNKYRGISSDPETLFAFLEGISEFQRIVDAESITMIEALAQLGQLTGVSYGTNPAGGFYIRDYDNTGSTKSFTAGVDTGTGTIQGDVYLDGQFVGQWLEKSLTDGGLVV